ncbi:MAG: glycosyltransferase, partial [Deltaproteobacteria bacterium]|nr:glycosyltransferase [Deltaproteobacteria bacterium]
PQEVFLTIVDDGRPGKTYAPEWVEKMGLSSRVSFTGKVPAETLRSLYRSSAAVVLPSLYEGFGLPAAEAMACGTPVVATRVGALPEVIGEDEAGILVPPRNPQALARGILRVLQNEGERGKMRLAGRQRVEEFFTWRKVAERTVAVYKELV